jgi:RNA polymerase sigma factor (sigma-70 family)
MHRVLQQLRVAAQRPDRAERTDTDLLRSFIDQRDETAFTALVRRHAAMVLGVCRRVTGDTHDAEDAFQAAFCVLLRKAASIRRREVLGSWLYGVAYRTALAAKVRRAKTRRREQQVDAMPQPIQTPTESNHDWQPLLDAALERLPERYRTPIVLCDLEGKSRKEAALQLRLSEGTLSSRLARGRRLLAQRLQRHGITLSGGALAALLAEQAAAAVPATLVHAVAQAGAQMLVGAAPAALAVSRSVLALTEGVMKAMLLGKLKSCAVVLLACVTLTAGGFWLTGRGEAQPPAASIPAGGPAPSVPSAKQPTILPGLGQGIENCASCHQLTHHAMRHPHDFAGQPQFRIEAVLAVPEGGGKTKPLASPSALIAQGQRTAFAMDAVLDRDGKREVVKYSWNIEVVRRRGGDVLVSLTLERKQRHSSAVVQGASVEFEDYVPLDAWKIVTDQAWTHSEFKIKVTSAAAAATSSPPSIPFPVTIKRDPAAPSSSPSASDERGETAIYKLKNMTADKVAAMLRELFGDRRQPGLSLSVDDRTNSLIVRAGTMDQATIAALLSKLDVPPAAAPKQDEMVNALKSILAQQSARATEAADDVANPLLALTRQQAGSPSVAISPDGARLAMGDKEHVWIIDVKSGKALSKTTTSDIIQSLAFSPDGKFLASGAPKGAVHLYDSATGKEVRRIDTAKPLVRIEFAVDGQTMLTVLLVTTTEPDVRVWDLNTGKLLRIDKTKGEKK